MPDTYTDVIDAWNSLRKLTATMRGSMAQKVLVCIFSDNKVLRSLALAAKLSDIKKPAPEGLLKTFKKFLSAHMKQNSYLYQKEIKEEITHISRIKDLKAQLVAVCVSGLVAIFIGISNFASNYLYGIIIGGDE